MELSNLRSSFKEDVQQVRHKRNPSIFNVSVSMKTILKADVPGTLSPYSLIYLLVC